MTCSTFDHPLRVPPVVIPFRLPFCVVLGSCYPPSLSGGECHSQKDPVAPVNECRPCSEGSAPRPFPVLGERFNLLRSIRVCINDGSNTGSLPGYDDLLGVEPGKVPRAPHYAPL